MNALVFRTDRKTQLLDITDPVAAAVAKESGTIAVVFVPHTTAGLLLQAGGEGARGVAADLEAAAERAVDEGADWAHAEEGDRNPASHIRAALASPSLTIPLVDGELALGRLQHVFLAEFDGPRDRTVYVTVAA